MSEKQVHDLYKKITLTLIEKNITVTTMESATSGQIASLITDTEGASAIMKGAFVTYSNEAKIKQGVDASILDDYGVYSKETAAAMACACRTSYQADIGIGVTGTMGNVDENNCDSVPGNVYFAIDFRGKVTSYHRELQPQPTRLAYKFAVAEEVGKELLHDLSCGFANVWEGC